MGTAREAVNNAGMACSNVVRGLHTIITERDLMPLVQAGDVQTVDIRLPHEYQQKGTMKVGGGGPNDR